MFSWNILLSALWSYAILQVAIGSSIDSCAFNHTKLEICEGGKNYLINYPSTFDGKVEGEVPKLKIKPTLTFLNLARFNHEEKSITIFVYLLMMWNDTRLHLTLDKYVFMVVQVVEFSSGGYKIVKIFA